MRGKGQKNTDAVRPYRITPAYAGKSQLEIEPFAPPQDHPRLCGEKQAIPHKELQEVGSPPPMRGKGPLAYPNVQHHRITPAYAGKSKIIRSGGSTSSGSPPPMRGKDEILGIDVHQTRITPAYAGKRQSFWHTWTTDQDHPRLCGEKMDIRQELRKNPGSPPPMRGKGRRTQNAAGHTRITPAYAGKRSNKEIL